MSDRPTYKDYLFHSESRYIKSGGRYYTMAVEKAGIRTRIFLGVYIAAVAALIVLSLTNIIWPIWVGELWLLSIPIQIILSKRRYNRARFVPVEENTEDWQKASKRIFSAVTMIVWIVVVLSSSILYSPGGFTVSYIRSQLDNNAIVEMYTIGGEKYYSDGDSSDQGVPYTITSFYEGDVWINIRVLHSPDTARLSFDGQPLPQKDQPRKSGTTILEMLDYFEQETFFSIPGDKLHDGSTLTLTCGGLTREWVFDVPNEEAS